MKCFLGLLVFANILKNSTQARTMPAQPTYWQDLEAELSRGEEYIEQFQAGTAVPTPSVLGLCSRACFGPCMFTGLIAGM